MIKWFDEETADKEVASLNLSTQDIFSYLFVNNKETENKRRQSVLNLEETIWKKQLSTVVRKQLYAVLSIWYKYTTVLSIDSFVYF